MDSSHASAARVWSLRQRKQMLPLPERPELYGFVCLYSTLLPQAGRQLELCWRTSRDSHPSEDLSKLRTGVSLWADGIMAGTAYQGCLGLSGYRSAPSIGRPNMRIMLRTGGPRAPGLTLAPSAKVFQSPDMTAWAVFFKVQKMGDTCPFTNHLFSGFFTTIFGPLFKNFLVFSKRRPAI